MNKMRQIPAMERGLHIFRVLCKLGPLNASNKDKSREHNCKEPEEKKSERLVPRTCSNSLPRDRLSAVNTTQLLSECLLSSHLKSGVSFYFTSSPLVGIAAASEGLQPGHSWEAGAFPASSHQLRRILSTSAPAAFPIFVPKVKPSGASNWPCSLLPHGRTRHQQLSRTPARDISQPRGRRGGRARGPQTDTSAQRL